MSFGGSMNVMGIGMKQTRDDVYAEEVTAYD